ncbi:HIRAN domain-containing protein [Leifsonia shinshuensis]|uniref:HIRAN domain-containing protein n=1 Tax=Leifsonia shinshuensis TaxID=150026 RepID=A0A7G6YA57_9MICO|nr:HIRAN domain-containing protein [Leifsonia shinshuensis]QNE35372.1 hypothetical protein F1C12_09680 [Leifsonia shinshuensis]
MGLLDKFRRKDVAGPPPRSAVTFTTSAGAVGLEKIACTTTVAKDSANALETRMGLGENGYLEVAATLQREPQNPADPYAVTVNVHGDRIGYVPSYVAVTLDLSEHAAVVAPVQLFTAITPKGLRVEGWVWLGGGTPRWEFSSSRRPPMTPDEKRKAAARGTDAMIAAAVAGGGARAAQFQNASVNGIHYLQTVEPIKQLKREGRLEEALQLCYLAIEGAERDRNGREPAPWYTEQAAIILRKLGRRDEEIAVLKRWLAACSPDRRAGTVSERLAKLQGLKP